MVFKKKSHSGSTCGPKGLGWEVLAGVTAATTRQPAQKGLGESITTYQDWHSPKRFLGFIISQKPRGLNPHRCPLCPPLPGACRNWREDNRRSEPQKI